MTTLQFANDTQDWKLIIASEKIVKGIIGHYSKELVLGFSNEETGVLRDNPTLLEGSAGVLVTLLSSVSEIDPVWNRMFLLV